MTRLADRRPDQQEEEEKQDWVGGVCVIVIVFLDEARQNSSRVKKRN